MGLLDGLIDSGLVGGLAAGGQGFIKGMNDAEDRKYKRMEFEAKAKARAEEDQRNEFNKRLEARKAGFLVPPMDQPMDPSALKWDTSKPQPQGGFNSADRVNVMKDNQSAAAVDKVVNDSQIKNHVQRIQGAQRIKSQLDEIRAGHIVDTSQFLNDLNTEYVNLLTGSNNAALGKLERTEYRTYAGDMANVLQKIKASPQSINSPEILSQLEKSVDSLKAVYQKNLAERGKLLQRSYAHNPDAANQQKAKIQELVGQFGGGNEPQGLLGGSPPSPGGGKIRVSNGKETLEIDPADLASAQADGYKPVGK